MATTSAAPDYSEEEEEEDYLKMTLGLLIPSAIGLAILTLLAICGNAMTIVAYVRDRRLRTVYDTYIFNLAVTDILLGCISMPFYAVYTLQEFTWPFGRAFCKIWLVIDFTLCLESVLLILLISLDRLLLIMYGPRYSTKETMRKAWLKVAISWVIAFLLFGPAIIGWDYWYGESVVEDMDCDVEFVNHMAFTTATAIIEFMVPLVALSVLNSMIYWKIRSRTKVMDAKKSALPNVPTQSVVPSEAPAEIPPHQTSLNGTAKPVLNQQISEPSAVSAVSHPNLSRTATKKAPPSKASSRLRRDLKAARFLATLVLVFLVCWAPYTITTIIIAFCDTCVNTSLYEFLNWLLWAKSSINPFLYAVNSSRYRYNFKRILFCFSRNEVVPSGESTINTVG